MQPLPSRKACEHTYPGAFRRFCMTLFRSHWHCEKCGTMCIMGLDETGNLILPVWLYGEESDSDAG